MGDLVPIRLDLEHDGIKVKDTFCWNLGEKQITPEEFALQLVEDLSLPDIFIDIIAQSIRKQISAFNVSRQNPQGKGDGRVGIRLELRLGEKLLTDHFEWDINSKLSNPEEFARGLCCDLRLEAEYAGLVAHAIRESLALKDSRIDQQVPPPIGMRILRDPVESGHWEPWVDKLTDRDLERLKLQEDREARLRRRHYGHNINVSDISKAVTSFNKFKQRRKIKARFHKGPGSGIEPTPEPAEYLDSQGPSQVPGAIANGDAVLSPVTPVSRLRSRTTPTVGHKVNAAPPPNLPYVCHNCGAAFPEISFMRRGPAGPRTLCTRCGASWSATGNLPNVNRRHLNPPGFTTAATGSPGPVGRSSRSRSGSRHKRPLSSASVPPPAHGAIAGGLAHHAHARTPIGLAAAAAPLVGPSLGPVGPAPALAPSVVARGSYAVQSTGAPSGQAKTPSVASSSPFPLPHSIRATSAAVPVPLGTRLISSAPVASRPVAAFASVFPAAALPQSPAVAPAAPLPPHTQAPISSPSIIRTPNPVAASRSVAPPASIVATGPTVLSFGGSLVHAPASVSSSASPLAVSTGLPTSSAPAPPASIGATGPSVLSFERSLVHAPASVSGSATPLAVSTGLPTSSAPPSCNLRPFGLPPSREDSPGGIALGTRAPQQIVPMSVEVRGQQALRHGIYDPVAVVALDEHRLAASSSVPRPKADEVTAWTRGLTVSDAAPQTVTQDTSSAECQVAVVALDEHRLAASSSVSRPRADELNAWPRGLTVSDATPKTVIQDTRSAECQNVTVTEALESAACVVRDAADRADPLLGHAPASTPLSYGTSGGLDSNHSSTAGLKLEIRLGKSAMMSGSPSESGAAVGSEEEVSQTSGGRASESLGPGAAEPVPHPAILSGTDVPSLPAAAAAVRTVGGRHKRRKPDADTGILSSEDQSHRQVERSAKRLDRPPLVQDDGSGVSESSGDSDAASGSGNGLLSGASPPVPRIRIKFTSSSNERTQE